MGGASSSRSSRAPGNNNVRAGRKSMGLSFNRVRVNERAARVELRENVFEYAR
jgi:hypothetical protein